MCGLCPLVDALKDLVLVDDRAGLVLGTLWSLLDLVLGNKAMASSRFLHSPSSSWSYLWRAIFFLQTCFSSSVGKRLSPRDLAPPSSRLPLGEQQWGQERGVRPLLSSVALPLPYEFPPQATPGEAPPRNDSPPGAQEGVGELSLPLLPSRGSAKELGYFISGCEESSGESE